MSEQFSPRCWLVIPAAGKGTRFGAEIPKQYLPLSGKTIAEHTLSRMLAFPAIEQVVVATAADDDYWPTLPQASDPRVQRVEGGAERAQSVLRGLRYLQDKAHRDDWVLVHDMARPCISHAELNALFSTLGQDKVGGILAIPVHDTVKRCDANGNILATVDRSQLWLAQTPQMFRFGVLLHALQHALESGAAITDEASAVEYLGLTPKVVQGLATNIKVTRPEDLALASHYLLLTEATI